MKKNILKMLERDDKWFLGGGNKLIWTPPFPAYLNYPGFWDYINYYDLKIDPGMTMSVAIDGVFEKLKFEEQSWDPAAFTSIFSSNRLKIIEEKSLLKNDFLGSKVKIINKTSEKMELDIVVWSSQEKTDELNKNNSEFHSLDGKNIVIKKNLYKGDRKPVVAYVELFLEDSQSYNISFSRNTANHPNVLYTPFLEKLTPRGLIEEIKTDGIDNNGLLYCGLQRKITLDPLEEKTFTYGISAGSSSEEVKKTINEIKSIDDITEISKRDWNEYFESLPYFECSDAFIEKYYWYRWFGLKLFTLDSNEGKFHYPAITEGLAYFRVFITYSSQCHMLETRWMNDKRIAQGSFLNFIENQKKDGCFPGHIYLNGVQENGFYHADWGRVIKETHECYPDMDFLKKIYPGLKDYLDYFIKNRDPESSGLYDVVDQFETGQEFMSRYLAVDEMADRYRWINNLRLKGVDSSVYVYNLKKCLAWIALQIGEASEVEYFEKEAEKTKDAILKYMWNEKEEMFFDVNPYSFEQTKIKTSICFYPYMTDIVDEKHLNGLKKHLFNPEEFWSEYPVRTTSKDDEYYSSFAEWKGKRHLCPWNGRVWPMTNSHIADLLGICYERFGDEEIREKLNELIEKFIKMMFHNGDLKYPNCYEHYNPDSGTASIYRGVDDYMHSWVIDLIMKYVIGINIGNENVRINPLNRNLDFYLDNLTIRNKHLIVEKKGDNIEYKYE